MGHGIVTSPVSMETVNRKRPGDEKSRFRTLCKMQIQEEGDVILNCVLAGDVESLRRHCETSVDASGVDEESQERDLFRYKDEVGRNALFVACMLGRSHVVKELLVKNGAHVNKPSTRGYTLLHCAACWGHLETVVTLLELGADIQAENFRRERPLEVAMRYSHTACADCLMVAEAKQDFVFYINYIRDIISDPEKIQGKLNKEDKNLCSNTCSAKSDWVQHAKNPAATDFTAQQKHMAETLQPVLSKLSAPDQSGAKLGHDVVWGKALEALSCCDDIYNKE